VSLTRGRKNRLRVDRPVLDSLPLRLAARIDRCKGFVRKTQELRKVGQVAFTVQYLGRLKGNQGDQSYDPPAGFDPEVHRAISVWCKRFTANFAAASLR
jgi:hypothetical protein